LKLRNVEIGWSLILKHYWKTDPFISSFHNKHFFVLSRLFIGWLNRYKYKQKKYNFRLLAFCPPWNCDSFSKLNIIHKSYSSIYSINVSWRIWLKYNIVKWIWWRWRYHFMIGWWCFYIQSLKHFAKFCQKINSLSKIENLVKNRKFWQIWKSFLKNWKFYQESKILKEMETFCQKLKILWRIENF